MASGIIIDQPYKEIDKLNLRIGRSNWDEQLN